MNRAVLHFPLDHPCGAGHFPGNPIVPGALLLAEAVRLVGGAAGLRFDSCSIKSAKFLHPVRPGDTVEIEFSILPQQEIRFQCAVGKVKVLAGAMDAATCA
jgi:3-hydroxyacyl-[acyl-carrier-protein] dehydratase